MSPLPRLVADVAAGVSVAVPFPRASASFSPPEPLSCATQLPVEQHYCTASPTTRQLEYFHERQTPTNKPTDHFVSPSPALRSVVRFEALPAAAPDYTLQTPNYTAQREEDASPQYHRFLALRQQYFSTRMQHV
jgi:hypothetical protein